MYLERFSAANTCLLLFFACCFLFFAILNALIESSNGDKEQPGECEDEGTLLTSALFGSAIGFGTILLWLIIRLFCIPRFSNPNVVITSRKKRPTPRPIMHLPRGKRCEKMKSNVIPHHPEKPDRRQTRGKKRCEFFHHKETT